MQAPEGRQNVVASKLSFAPPGLAIPVADPTARAVGYFLAHHPVLECGPISQICQRYFVSGENFCPPAAVQGRELEFVCQFGTGKIV